MKYEVNEIFYSVQTEGMNAGKPAIFVRLCGCNLACPWCDTKGHERGKTYSSAELERAVKDLVPENAKVLPMVVFTGGEPTLQLIDEDPLLPGFFKTIETNGILTAPYWIHWRTFSPKQAFTVEDLKRIKPSEIKLINDEHCEEYLNAIPRDSQTPQGWRNVFIQSLEQDGKMNVTETVELVKRHPDTRMSIQYHKLFGIR